MPFLLSSALQSPQELPQQKNLIKLNVSTVNPPPSDNMPSLKSNFGSIFHKSPSTRRPAFNSNNPHASNSSAPPAYSAAPPSNAKPTPSSSTAAPRSTYIEDSEFSFLSTFDTVFLIDDSSSMTGRSWRETRDALKTITPICTAYDADGIDLYFLNEPDNVEYKNVTTPADVEAIFNNVTPRGGTPTCSRLHEILRPYLRELEMKGEENVKPLNIIVITDGLAADDVESVILSATCKLDKLDAPAWQVGIQFFQVGEDAEAKKMLEYLDDHLGQNSGNTKERTRDMVDTMSWVGKRGTGLNGEGVLKCVLGAVVRRHDNAEKNSSKLRPSQ
jgi:hypothetical protein